MPKIAFLGAGSTVFAKAVLGDCIVSEFLRRSDIALHDVDSRRLRDSERMLANIVRSNNGAARITATLDRRKALARADYVINAIQVGGYRPCTVTDFRVPARFGLRQTIGDTLGIGGIFRALRTIPVMLKFARDMEELCPDAWFLNYTNPISMLVGAMLRATPIRTVGLCHSVQVCAPHLCRMFDLPEDGLQWKVAGINHQGWLLEISRHGKDLYPAIRKRADSPSYRARSGVRRDAVRLEIMRRFGYYLTESSEHSSEYVPWFIKARYPGLIAKFQIPLDEYPRRCERQIAGWERLRERLVTDAPLVHKRTGEYASYILEAMETGRPLAFGGNVLNNGIIANLPSNAVVEVPCMADRNGVQAIRVGALPEQCAALNRTNINVQLMTIEAALTRRRDAIYQAAMLDPHTAAELPIDKIVKMCDALIKAHGKWLPKYK